MDNPLQSNLSLDRPEPGICFQGDQQACQDAFNTFVEQLRQDLQLKGTKDIRVSCRP